MEWLIYIVYPALAALFLYGVKTVKNDEISGFMSAEQSKQLAGFFSVCIMLHHISQKAAVASRSGAVNARGLGVFFPTGYFFVSFFLFCSGFGLMKSMKTKEDYLLGFGQRRILPVITSFVLTNIIFLIVRAGMGGAALPVNPYSWYVYTIVILYVCFYMSVGKMKRGGIAALAALITLYCATCWFFAPGEDSSVNKKNVTEKRQKNDEDRQELMSFAIALAIIIAGISGVAFLPRLFGIGVIKPFAELESVSVSDHFYFGSFPQSSGETGSIEWRVLAVEDGKALVISEHLLDAREFDRSGGDWKNSELRRWLNDDFMETAFSDTEENRIMLTANDDTGTQEYIYCLSVEEAKRYFSDTGKRIASPTYYAIERGAYTSTGYPFNYSVLSGNWWLRTPGSTETIVMSVNTYGSISGVRAGSGECCVRPAFWIKLDMEQESSV